MGSVLAHTAATVVSVAVALTASDLASAATSGGHLLSEPAGSAAPSAKPGRIAGYDFAAAVYQGSVTFKVPAVTCGVETQGIGLGLGVEDMIGEPTNIGTVFVACVSGAPFYQLSATANGVKGTGDANNVQAGDSVTVSYRVTGSTLTVTTKDNKTTGTVSASGSATPADTHLTFGSFPLFSGAGDPLSVPDFGSATLSKVTVNAKKPKNGKPIVGRDIKLGPYDKGSFTLTYAR